MKKDEEPKRMAYVISPTKLTQISFWRALLVKKQELTVQDKDDIAEQKKKKR